MGCANLLTPLSQTGSKIIPKSHFHSAQHNNFQKRNLRGYTICPIDSGKNKSPVKISKRWKYSNPAPALSCSRQRRKAACTRKPLRTNGVILHPKSNSRSLLHGRERSQFARWKDTERCLPKNSVMSLVTTPSDESCRDATGVYRYDREGVLEC